MKLELLFIGFVVFFFVLIKNVYLVKFIVEYEGKLVLIVRINLNGKL